MNLYIFTSPFTSIVTLSQMVLIKRNTKTRKTNSTLQNVQDTTTVIHVATASNAG